MADHLVITGVRFEDADGTFCRHTLNDYGMYLATQPTKDPPKVKGVYVNIPGADGVLDLTESVDGEVTYENRTIRMEFAAKVDEAARDNFMETVNADLHGRVLRMYPDRAIYTDLPEFYYEGRVSVQWTDQTYWKLHCVITMDATPYKICDNKTTKELNNSLVQSRDPLTVTVRNWRDVNKINGTPAWPRLEFGTNTFPSQCFYGFEWAEIVFEVEQPNKSVDITAYDKAGHSWTYTDTVKTRINSVNGRVEAYVYYLFDYQGMGSAHNGVNTRTIYRIDLKTNSSSINKDIISRVSIVRAKVRSDYAQVIVSTDMPSYPDVYIETTATNGFYFTWNDKGFNSLEFTGTGSKFAGTDQRLRLVRGLNVITLRPRDTSVANKLSFTFRRGVF